MAATLSLVQADGKVPVEILGVKILVRIGVISWAHFCNTNGWIPSGPGALCRDKFFNSLKMPSDPICKVGMDGCLSPFISGSEPESSFVKTDLYCSLIVWNLGFLPCRNDKFLAIPECRDTRRILAPAFDNDQNLLGLVQCESKTVVDKIMIVFSFPQFFLDSFSQRAVPFPAAMSVWWLRLVKSSMKNEGVSSLCDCWLKLLRFLPAIKNLPPA